ASQSLNASISAIGAPASNSFSNDPDRLAVSSPSHPTSIPSPMDISIPTAGWNGVYLAPWNGLVRLFSQSGQVTSATHSSSAKKPSARENREERNSPYTSPSRLSRDEPLK